MEEMTETDINILRHKLDRGDRKVGELLGILVEKVLVGLLVVKPKAWKWLLLVKMAFVLWRVGEIAVAIIRGRITKEDLKAIDLWEGSVWTTIKEML